MTKPPTRGERLEKRMSAANARADQLFNEVMKLGKE